MAARLAPLGPLPVVTSPLTRCRMTAAPLGSRWGRAPAVVDAVRELPSPGRDGEARSRFLAGFLKSRWPDALTNEGTWLADWREGLVCTLTALDTDTVVVSHYVAINVIVGLAAGSELVTAFRPGHASVTVIDQSRGQFTLVELGAEAETQLTSG